MTEARYTYEKDYTEDCITITDSEEELKTDFGSDICLYPMEDAITVVNELNIQCAINKMLVEQLENFEDIQDIKYWMEDVRSDLE